MYCLSRFMLTFITSSLFLKAVVVVVNIIAGRTTPSKYFRCNFLFITAVVERPPATCAPDAARIKKQKKFHRISKLNEQSCPCIICYRETVPTSLSISLSLTLSISRTTSPPPNDQWRCCDFDVRRTV